MARKQYRGCSRLVYATVTVGDGGAVTYGTPAVVAPVKAISRTIDEASEEVWADNALQETTYGGKKITRSFEVTPLAADVEADLFGLDEVTLGGSEKGYATPTGGDRPYFAFGYALHDGDPDHPCEVVWAYRGKAVSLTKSANTIKQGDTASEGQTLEVEFTESAEKFTATGKHNMDMNVPVTASTTWVDKWFASVITPDNASTPLK